MVALWFLADSTSQAVNAWITPYFTKDTEVAFFGILGLCMSWYWCFVATYQKTNFELNA